MRKIKTYQNDKPLEYGFILNKQVQNTIALASICEHATSSITIVDTGNYVLDFFLRDCIGILNEKKVVVAGVVSKKTLSSLKGRGVLTGFFRATDVVVNLGLIIIDKKEAWACFGDNCYFRIANGSEEIFQYANHLLWTKTDDEYSFGESRKVQQAMLSVVMPAPIAGQPFETTTHEYATSGLLSSKGIIVNKFGVYEKPAIALPLDCRAYKDFNRLFVEILPNASYEVIDGGTMEFGYSIDPNHATPQDLVWKNIFYKGKEQQVIDVEEIKETIAVPLDQIDSYEPDFDAIYARRTRISVKTEISVEIVPMHRDDSYQLSPNYKLRKKIEDYMADGLERLEKLDLGKDVAKRIQSVRTEKILEERVCLYNKLVSSLDYGVDALKNKKNSFPTVNQSEEAFVVPHEMLGTLLIKDKANYLALKDAGLVKKAKEWLKDNKIEAALILD